MNKDITKATEILFDLVVGLEPRLSTLHDWYSELCQKIDLWSRSEGNQGVNRAKSILGQGLLAIFGEDTVQLDFVKTDGSKIPQLVLPLVNRVKSLKYDSRLLSGVISICRVTDLWLGQPSDYTVDEQLKIIQNSQLPRTAMPIIQEFEKFLKLFLDSYPSHPVVKAFNKAIHLDDRSVSPYTASKGPNGSLTQNAHKDVKSLAEAVTLDGNTLLSHIKELQERICEYSDFSFRSSSRFSESVLNDKHYLELQVSDSPGKINYIPEKSGKIRLIAQPDYFSQVSLKPLHQWAFNVLRAFPADCTFDQGSAIPKVIKWHEDNRYVASYDQSSCTDLFPFEIQLKVLESRFGSPLTESVKTVMSDRDWILRMPSGKSKKIRWSVGQPMGMMLSWPLMALTHHFLVQFAYWRSSGFSFPRKGPYNNYVICGDDIVIADKSVADSYLKVVTNLGMKVNRNKSHISGKGTEVPHISEFAKITIWKGQPLFPIRPNMVLSSVKDWKLAVPLFLDISKSDGFNARLKFIQMIIKKHYSRGSRFLIPLLTIPRELGGTGYRDSVSLKQKFQLIHARQIHPLLLFLVEKIRSGLILERRSFEIEGIAESLDTDTYLSHPLVTYSRQYGLNKYFGLEPRTVPKPEQLVVEILSQGLRSYDRFLTPQQNQCVPPHWIDPDIHQYQKDRTLWIKALSKPKTLPQSVIEDLCLASVTELFVFEDFESYLPLLYDEFHTMQYNIVQNVMLARRSI